MQEIKHAGRSNNADSTLVKTISSEKNLTWLRPSENQVFTITQEATLPEIVFEFQCAAMGEYKWSWVIEWEAKVSGLRERVRKGNALQVFKESGSFISANKSWAVDFSEKVLGGKLTVTVTAGTKTLTRTVVIKGQNPTVDCVAVYIATLDDMTGFEALLEQETGCKHFIDFDNEPIVAFDEGYGITQMTNPAPTYEQVWNWKANIAAGSSIYKEKVQAAKKYLGQAQRTYTDDQLRHETFSRWNGGAYHEWDSAANLWVRKSNMLCDSQTGNIGWSMNNHKNTGKTESELRERDKDTYTSGSKGQSDEHSWTYSGVCYADHVLDK
ncbi:hypothetical protein SB766_21005 [Pseudomonas sp. SIMBA_077]